MRISKQKYRLSFKNINIGTLQGHQLSFSKELAKVHIVSPGDQLPFTNNSIDFVINSHVLEHFFDPIKAIKEWLRVVKCGEKDIINIKIILTI